MTVSDALADTSESHRSPQQAKILVSLTSTAYNSVVKFVLDVVWPTMTGRKR